MEKLTKLLAAFLLITISTSYQLMAGTTGKISGVITDKSNGEVLLGASIVVVGTSYGAASDINGRYTILNVPPGTYDVQVTFIGYRKTLIEGIRVFIDQTVYLDASLESQSIEVGELVVLAQRNIIKKDVATSGVAVTDREIAALPITNIISAIGLQAGIRGGWESFGNNNTQPQFVSNYNRGKVSVQGGLSIRGGEGDAILFMQDGITLRDPRNNEPISKIPLSSIKEISVERGGFNAEYGQVRSGIVNIISREGAKQSYSGEIQLRMSPPSPRYYRGDGIRDVLDPYSFVLRPFFDPDVCWTGTNNGVWDEYMRDQYPSFSGGWNEVARRLNMDNNPNNDLTPAQAQRVFMYETRKKQINNQPDYDIDAGFGGPIPYISRMLGDLRFFASYRNTREMLLWPMNRPDYKDYDASVQVISDINQNMKLRLSALFGKQFTVRNSWDATGNYYYPRTPQNVADRVSSISLPSDLVGMFSDFNFSYADIGHRSLAAKFTHTFNPKTFYEVSIEQFRRDYNVGPQGSRDTTQKSEIVAGFFEDTNPFGYWPYEVNGVVINGGQHIARARDFSVVNSTTVKADIVSQVSFQNLLKGGVEFVYNDLDFDYGTIQSGGQAKEIYQNRVQMRLFPVRAAAYIQDKMEFREFTINAGLRLDYSDSKVDWWALNPYDRNFFSSNYSPTIQFEKIKAEPQWQFSPRIGIAHPITENSKLFFNYGYFKQIPQYESMFRVERDASGSITSFGNPNLTLAKTVSYELGFDYLLFDEFLLQAAGFYNDITDQQDFTSYNSRVYGFSYTQSTSHNYEDIRGFELSVRKTPGDWWSGFANYTYQVTTTGHFGSSRFFDSKDQQQRWDDATVNLYQNRQNAQPYARANLNFMSPDEFGPKLLGYNILGGWGLNFTIDWQAGYWTAWNPGGSADVTYNVQSVDYFNTYLRFDKNINLGKFKVQLFVDINNLFNTLRLWNTNDFDYMSSLHFPRSDDYDNVPGDDKVGDYRNLTAKFQPMKRVNNLPTKGVGSDRAWYYVDATQKYYEWKNNEWNEVDSGRLNKVLDDKAYIDMPNASTYWFLDPRRVFFGAKLSFNL